MEKAQGFIYGKKVDNAMHCHTDTHHTYMHMHFIHIQNLRINDTAKEKRNFLLFIILKNYSQFSNYLIQNVSYGLLMSELLTLIHLVLGMTDI